MNRLLNYLEPDKWYRRGQVIYFLALQYDKPHQVIEEMLTDGRLERDHTGDICMPRICWLKETVNGKESLIGKYGYPRDWDELTEVLSISVPILDRKVSVFPTSGFYLTKEGKKIEAIGIKNKGLMANLTIRAIIDMIRSDRFAQRTQELRDIDLSTKEGELLSKTKKTTLFSYATFSGTFSYAADKNILEHSGLICIDLDGLANPKAVQQVVRTIDGYAFSFISPRGRGLKVVFEIDPNLRTQKIWYTGITRLLEKQCGLSPQEIDESCSNVSRACFLSHDADIDVNPSL